MNKTSKVFCIGLGRTGTTTFQDCMRILGYNHRGWSGPELGLMALLDFNSIIPTIEKFESFDDYPFPLIYQELASRFPDSKFILTRRRNVDLWVESVIREANRKKYNDSDNIWYHGELNKIERRCLLAERYKNHLDSVRLFFSGSPNFLEICWEEGHGWEHLCDFLVHPIPNQKLPHRNKSQFSTDNKLLLETLLKQKNYNKIYLHLRELNDPDLNQMLINMLRVNNTTANKSVNMGVISLIHHVRKLIF
jgi:hypothetical protein